MPLYTLTQTKPDTGDVIHKGGEIEVIVSGTFGGASVKMQVWHQDSEIVNLTDDDFNITSDDVRRVIVASNTHYNIFADGATGTTDIKVSTNVL